MHRAAPLVMLWRSFAPPEPSSPAIELQWIAPAQCPDRAAVHAGALAHARPGGAQVFAHGEIVRDDSGWSLALQLRTSSRSERRELHAETCEALGEAAALLIAAAADPSAADPPAPEVPEPRPAIATPPPSPAREPGRARASVHQRDAPVPPRRRRPQLRGLVRLELMPQFFRRLPAAVAASVGGAIGLASPRARIELAAHYVTPSNRGYDDGSGISGRFDLWTIAPSGCYTPGIGRVSFPICAGVELGGMRGRSRGVSQDSRAQGLYVGLPLAAAVLYSPIPRVGLWLGPRASVTLRSPRFHIRDRNELFRAGPIALGLVAGVEVRFP